MDEEEVKLTHTRTASVSMDRHLSVTVVKNKDSVKLLKKKEQKKADNKDI